MFSASFLFSYCTKYRQQVQNFLFSIIQDLGVVVAIIAVHTQLNHYSNYYRLPRQHYMDSGVIMSPSVIFILIPMHKKVEQPN